MPKVELHHVEKIFPGGEAALRDLSMAVDDGELLVVLGPSGCGKSTLLRLLAGLEVPSAGRIEFDGRVVNELSPQARNIAMVFQNYALYPHMSVRRNLEFPLRMLGRSRQERERRVRETAELLGLGDLLERKPRHLSGGQAQRVAMGRAIVRDPVLFLMDEPLSNLDAKLRVEMRSVITELQQRMGTTTVYVTHDQVEAMTLGQRVAVLRAGRLHQLAPPGDLYDRPADLFVGGFLGSPPMNLLRVDEVLGGENVAIRLGKTELPLPAESGALARLASTRDRVAFVGLRPEAFSWAPGPDHPPAFQALLASVEVLGHEQILYLQTDARVVDPETLGDPGAPGLLAEGAGKLAARLPADRTLRTGDTVRLAVDSGRLLWFDAEGRLLDPFPQRRTSK